MFKLLRPIMLASLVILLLAVTACSGAAAKLPATATAPKPATLPAMTATPIAAQPTATPAPTQAMTPTAAKPTTALATTRALTSSAEVKITPAAPKATPASLKPAVSSTPAKVMTSTTETTTTLTTSQTTSMTAKPEMAAEMFMAKMTAAKTLGEILTDNKGMTLYTFKDDKPNESMCSAACAKTWQPVLVTDEAAKLTAAPGITGKLGVFERHDGTYQVTYDDMPLYRYIQDTKPGETKGETVGEMWHVVSLNAIK